MSIDTKLLVEINDEFEALSQMEVGGETYRTTVNGLAMLLDRAIEIDKNEEDRREREEAHREEQALKRQEYELKQLQLQEEKRDHLIKNCLTAAGIIIPTVVTIWGTIVSMRFEKEDTITTVAGRSFFSRLFPRK